MHIQKRVYINGKILRIKSSEFISGYRDKMFPIDGEHISPFIYGETHIIYLLAKLYELLPI